MIREQQTLMFGIDPSSNGSGTRGQGNDRNMLCCFLSLEMWGRWMGVYGEIVKEITWKEEKRQKE